MNIKRLFKSIGISLGILFCFFTVVSTVFGFLYLGVLLLGEPYGPAVSIAILIFTCSTYVVYNEC